MTSTDFTAPVMLGHAWPPGDRTQLKIWCERCDRFHLHMRHDDNPECPYRYWDHGNGGPPCECPPGAGDRWTEAHCLLDSGSPLRRTGYWLREVPDDVPIMPPKPFKRRSGFDPVELPDPYVVAIQAAWSDYFYREEL
jgi:hypothetical protein